MLKGGDEKKKKLDELTALAKAAWDGVLTVSHYDRYSCDITFSSHDHAVRAAAFLPNAVVSTNTLKLGYTELDARTPAPAQAESLVGRLWRYSQYASLLGVAVALFW